MEQKKQEVPKLIVEEPLTKYDNALADFQKRNQSQSIIANES